MDTSCFGEMSLRLFLLLAVSDEDDQIIFYNPDRRRRHQYWMAPHLSDRVDMSQRNTLAKLEVDFLRLGEVEEFRRTLRMPPHLYAELLEKLRPSLYRMNTNYRRSISPEERLSLTMRYLALGDSVVTLHHAYLVGRSTVLPLVRDTCKAIVETLKGEYLRTPTKRPEWESIATDYLHRWNMPNVLGSVDGKHIRMRCPHKSGSLYYNYKNFYSIVLMAVVGPDYKFIYVDVGAEGRASDSGLWRSSPFYRDVTAQENPLQIPEPRPLYPGSSPVPYYFVGDDAFALGEHLMKPFPSANLTPEDRVYNYCLSRCRRVVENAFGILATRFRIFRREQDMEPPGVELVTMACIVLHNLLREKAAGDYMPAKFADWEGADGAQHPGAWRQEDPLHGLKRGPTKRNHTNYVKGMRLALKSWCLSPMGELPWQYNFLSH